VLDLRQVIHQVEQWLSTAPSGSGRNHLARGLQLVLALGFAWFGIIAVHQTPLASAHNDVCADNTPGWVCYWYDPDLQTQTRHWFNAVNTNRNWTYAGVADIYGGSVANKCVNIKRHGDGTIFQVACGSGSPGAFIPGSRVPGYLFNVHSAAGPRYISSDGYH
jgi:hypothetical protein